MKRFAAAGIVIVIALGIVGTVDVAEEYTRGAQEKVMRPKRVIYVYRELLCDCVKIHGGSFLRLQVVQQRDREFCKAACIYEDGTVTKGTI